MASKVPADAVGASLVHHCLRNNRVSYPTWSFFLGSALASWTSPHRMPRTDGPMHIELHLLVLHQSTKHEYRAFQEGWEEGYREKGYGYPSGTVGGLHSPMIPIVPPIFSAPCPLLNVCFPLFLSHLSFTLNGFSRIADFHRWISSFWRTVGYETDAKAHLTAAEKIYEIAVHYANAIPWIHPDRLFAVAALAALQWHELKLPDGPYKLLIGGIENTREALKREQDRDKPKPQEKAWIAGNLFVFVAVVEELNDGSYVVRASALNLTQQAGLYA